MLFKLKIQPGFYTYIFSKLHAFKSNIDTYLVSTVDKQKNVAQGRKGIFICLFIKSMKTGFI